MPDQSDITSDEVLDSFVATLGDFWNTVRNQQQLYIKYDQPEIVDTIVEWDALSKVEQMLFGAMLNISGVPSTLIDITRRINAEHVQASN